MPGVALRLVRNDGELPVLTSNVKIGVIREVLSRKIILSQFSGRVNNCTALMWRYRFHVCGKIWYNCLVCWLNH